MLVHPANLFHDDTGIHALAGTACNDKAVNEKIKGCQTMSPSLRTSCLLVAQIRASHDPLSISTLAHCVKSGNAKRPRLSGVFFVDGFPARNRL